jgi:uncharacterized membrane protein (UPF0127 family)
MRVSKLTLQTSSGLHVVSVKLAISRAEQQRGLKWVRHLPDGTGMLFLYESPQEVTMWMQDTYIPLDMVFIRATCTVHRVEASTVPRSSTIIASKGDVVAVLELAAGTAKRLELQPGDQVLHPVFVRGRS